MTAMYTLYYIHADEPTHVAGISSPFLPDCAEEAGDCHRHGVQWYVLDSRGLKVLDSEDVE